jgi:replicative DNA helicase
MNPIQEFINPVASNIVQGIEIPTGYPQLDQITRGLHRKEVTLIAGRSSMGKTAWMIDLVLEISQKYKVGIFSLEMTKEQLIERMIANKQSVSYTDLKMGKVVVDEKVTDYLGGLQVWINDIAGQDVVQMCKTIAECSQTFDCIFIDYLQLARPPAEFKRQRYQEIDRIAEYLREIAKQKNIAVVLLCQLNREVERRDNHKPRLSDLRESGGIEQVIDTAILLYRPSYYNIYETLDDKSKGRVDNHFEFQDDGEAYLIIAKNRNGPTGEVPVVWQGPNMSFKSINWKLEENF